MAIKVAPLKGSFMVVAIAGFFITMMLVDDLSWKFTFMIFFSTMFIASMISTTHAPVVTESKKRK